MVVMMVYESSNNNLNGFCLNEKIAKTYISSNNKLNLYLDKVEMTDDEYNKFLLENGDKMLKYYKLKNGDDFLIINKTEKKRLIKEGVIIYDRT